MVFATTRLPQAHDAIAPDGSEGRILWPASRGSLAADGRRLSAALTVRQGATVTLWQGWTPSMALLGVFEDREILR